jgi:hypothetical protein
LLASPSQPARRLRELQAEVRVSLEVKVVAVDHPDVAVAVDAVVEDAVVVLAEVLVARKALRFLLLARSFP